MYKHSRKRSTRKDPKPDPLFAGRPLPELYRGGYGFVPKLVMENPDLSAKAKALYCVYAAVAGTHPEGRCFCSWKTISAYLNGTAVSTLRAARAELIAKNYIQMSRKGCRAVIKLSPLLLPSNNISGAYVPRNLITGEALAISEKCIFMLIAAIGCEHRGYAARLTYDRGVEKLVIGRNTFSQHLHSLISRGLVKQLATSTYIACTGLAPEPEKPAFALPEALKEPFARLCALSVNANHPEAAAERYAQWVEKGASPETIEKAYKKYVSVKRNDYGMEDRYFPRLSNWLDPDNGSNGCSGWISDARQAAYYAKKKAERLAAARAEAEKAAQAAERAAQAAEGTSRPEAAPHMRVGDEKKEVPTSPRLEKLRAKRSELIASCIATRGRNAAEVTPKLKEIEALIAEEENHALSSTQALPMQYPGAPYAVPRPCTTRRELLDDSQNGACAPGRGFEAIEEKPALSATLPETQGVESCEELASDECLAFNPLDSLNSDELDENEEGLDDSLAEKQADETSDGQDEKRTCETRNGQDEEWADETKNGQNDLKGKLNDKRNGKPDNEQDVVPTGGLTDKLASKQDEKQDELRLNKPTKRLDEEQNGEVGKRPGVKSASASGVCGRVAEFSARCRPGERRRRPASRTGFLVAYGYGAAISGQRVALAVRERQERPFMEHIVMPSCAAPRGVMSTPAAPQHAVDMAEASGIAGAAAAMASLPVSSQDVGRPIAGGLPVSAKDNLLPPTAIETAAGSPDRDARAGKTPGSAPSCRFGGWVPLSRGRTVEDFEPSFENAPKTEGASHAAKRKPALFPISPASGRLGLPEHGCRAVVYDGRVGMTSQVQHRGISPPAPGWGNDASFSGQLPLSGRQKDANGFNRISRRERRTRCQTLETRLPHRSTASSSKRETRSSGPHAASSAKPSPRKSKSSRSPGPPLPPPQAGTPPKELPRELRASSST